MEARTAPAVQRHVLVLGDQLTRVVGPLADADSATTTVLLVEAAEWARRRPYHRQKLGLVWSAMRHFGDELALDGFDVRHHRVERFEEGLAAHLAAFPAARLELMEPADHGVGEALAAVTARLGGKLVVVPNALWLSDATAFDRWTTGRKRLRMEDWYRTERRRTGWLMVDVEGRPTAPGDPDAMPASGRWNLDSENRRVPPDGTSIPSVRTFPPDGITAEVLDEVDAAFPDHPGATEGFAWPVTRNDALAALEDFVEHRLRDFGPFEDAMVDGESVLFHSQLSVPLNLGLLMPREVVETALAAYHDPARQGDPDRAIPLASIEGFVRQILGWREFMRHVYRTRMPELREANALSHRGALPGFYWSGETRMRCLGQAVRQVLATGHTHHIQRLMVLGNWAILAGVRPDLVTDWFHELYVDSYDWVVTPNVMAMSQYAEPAVTSKPYVAGGAYIDRMSDHCGRCPYDPRNSTGPRACPFTTLYWAFVDRHLDLLAGNPRTGAVAASWRRRDPAVRTAVLERAAEVLQLAGCGEL